MKKNNSTPTNTYSSTSTKPSSSSSTQDHYYSQCVYEAIEMGLPWMKLHQLFLIDSHCMSALSHHDPNNNQVLHPCLQAASNKQCNLEVLYHLAMFSIDYLCTLMYTKQS